jgi:sporulation protein YlmC with PRC-barrel domain
MTPIWAIEMTGTEVRTPAGETLGTIEDFVFDRSLRSVECVVLSTSNMPGVTGATRAVRLEALKLDTENECFVIDVEREVPALDTSADPDYWQRVLRHYGLDGA